MTAANSKAMVVSHGQGGQAGQASQGGAGGEVKKAQLQKAVVRRTIDASASFFRLAQVRLVHPRIQEVAHPLPIFSESLELLPPSAYLHLPAVNFDTKWVVGNLNKARSPVNTVLWMPDGRRVITGANSGELTVWDGRQFSWESVLQGHEAPVRCLRYTHSEHILLSSDDNGRIKLWNGKKDNFLDPLHVITAHREPCRCLSLAPTDRKFASASDDSTIKVHDFVKGGTEATLMGHGGDVRWVDWHPRQGLLASGSKDALVKLWDPRSGGACVATLHGHKNGVMQVHWNPLNGNWLLSASRDQTLKIFDVRSLRELATFTGHARDVTSAAWHPVQEELFVSGSHDGAIMFWLASRTEAQWAGQGGRERWLAVAWAAQALGAHEKEVWALAWHPLGHCLASGGGDLTTQLWCRSRPGDLFRERPGADPPQQATQAAGGASAAAPQRAGPGGAGQGGGTGGAQGGGGALLLGGAGGAIPGLGDVLLKLQRTVASGGAAGLGSGAPSSPGPRHPPPPTSAATAPSSSQPGPRHPPGPHAFRHSGQDPANRWPPGAPQSGFEPVASHPDEGGGWSGEPRAGAWAGPGHGAAGGGGWERPRAREGDRDRGQGPGNPWGQGQGSGWEGPPAGRYPERGGGEGGGHGGGQRGGPGPPGKRARVDDPRTHSHEPRTWQGEGREGGGPGPTPMYRARPAGSEQGVGEEGGRGGQGRQGEGRGGGGYVGPPPPGGRWPGLGPS
ncbi:WD40-repeat-containing domain protein [Haematococcus lacustris]